jgi:hypothetical protein
MKEPKYKIGDEVWALMDDQIVHAPVDLIRMQCKITYQTGEDKWEEEEHSYWIRKVNRGFKPDQLFPTKQALIDSL